MEPLRAFDQTELDTVNNAVAMAEELVSNHYKMSASQWLRPKYDIKTLSELTPEETIHGPFAQLIRYEGKHRDSDLGSSAYDFYKICLQDHSILAALGNFPEIKLFPFALYIVSHELIHIVRFSKFLQRFDASTEERLAEEARVHQTTHALLREVRIPGLPDVLAFYKQWRNPLDRFDG